jgi:Spy/CpxP family protein refolding chaperone
MNSKFAIITLTTAVLAATGIMAKETATGQHRAGNRLDRMSAMLNLTDQQKEQAKSIFMAEREAANPAREQLRAEQKAVRTAIESHKSEAEIRQLAKDEAPALGDLAAMRASAFSKFYAELTPAQQQKLATMHQNRRARKSARPQENAPVDR